MERKVDLEKMKSEGGKAGAEELGRDRESSWLKARLHFAFGVAAPRVWEGGVWLLIGQLTLLYPLFLPFWGDGEAAACGSIKLPGNLPGRGEANEVLAKKDGGGGEGVCEEE